MFKLNRAQALRTLAEESVVFSRHPGKPSRVGLSRRVAENTSPPYKFCHARTALKYGLLHAGLTAGDGVLVPDFICASAIEPLDQQGIHPQYYLVDDALQPNWDALPQLVTDSTRAFLIVHYFGQPQPLQACEAFCRNHSLMLIEDNAHGFGATHDGRLLGTFGEVGVTAPRKSFPVVNGAYLYLSSDALFEAPDLTLQPSSSTSIKQWIRRGLSSVPPVQAAIERRRSMIDRKRRDGPPPDYGSQEAFRDPPLGADYAMDASTHTYLQQQDIKAVREKRWRIYEMWQSWAECRGLKPVFPELAPGAMPLVFPAYTASRDESLSWFASGHRAGIDIHSWPTLPRRIVNEDGRAMRLWERLVCFPIHQYMNENSLHDRIAELCSNE